MIPWKRLFTWTLLVLAGLFALWKAVYVVPLDAYREARLIESFSPVQLVSYHWEHHLEATLDQALPVDRLSDLPEAAGRVAVIGGKTHYLLKGTAEVAAVTDQQLLLTLPDGQQVRLPVKLLFGNTAAAASGWFHANDFANSMDYNAASACLNQRLLAMVVKPLLDSLRLGDRLEWVGAVALNPDQPLPDLVDLVPFRLTLADGPSVTR